MAIDKATYWLAVGVLALGLNSTFQNQEAQWAHSFADQARLSAEGFAERGLAYLSMAEVMLGGSPADSPRLQAALVRLQVKTAQAQAALASREASRGVLEAQRVHLQFERRQMAYVSQDLDLCPDKGMVHVPAVHIPKVDVRVPDMAMPNVQVRIPEVHMPSVRVQVPEVHVTDVDVNLQPMLDQVQNQVQNLSYLKSMEKYRALESLKNLPNASDFDFTDAPDFSHPNVRVVIHTNAHDNGPI